jgi:membrane-bound lytic murein transglycosylase B
MPPHNAQLLATPEPKLRTTGDPRVDAYRERLLTDHTSRDWRPYFVRLLADVRADPSILAEHDKLAKIDTAAEYVRYYVTPDRIARGRKIYRNIGVGKTNAMPVELQVALWGMLSDYGARRPQYDALQALLVLGAYDRAGAGHEFQLHHAAAKVLTGEIPRAQLKAFATGKIGQTHTPVARFPEWARDGNGDGKIDIWNNRSDILATIAWSSWEGYVGMPVAVPVRVPNYDPNNPREARYLRSLRAGPNVPPSILRRWDGRAWRPEELGSGGTLVGPITKGGPSFLLLRPAWPVNSRDPVKPLYPGQDDEMGFALAASLLADAIAGRSIPPLR